MKKPGCGICCRKRKKTDSLDNFRKLYLLQLKSYERFVRTRNPEIDIMSLIHHINDKDDFDNQLKEAGSKLVVVDFYATWCGPCKIIAPKLEEMAQTYTDVIFLKVDVDDCEEVATAYQISCMPTFMFFKKGQKVAEFSGANAEKIRELVLANK